ncbi:MAG: cell division protein SepF [Mogibacterium sp.]|nr:cell division protein SepF [Mogibacterium sp.]
MGFKDAMNKLIGIEDDDFDEEITQEEIDREKAKLSSESSSRAERRREEQSAAGSRKHEFAIETIEPLNTRAPQNKALSMNGSGPFKMLVIEPKSFDECTKLVDNLKSRKPVIINLEKVETDLARKMFDFMSGATYALNGNVQRVTSNIFIFAPANVDIAAKLNRETAAEAVSAYTPSGEAKSPWSR